MGSISGYGIICLIVIIIIAVNGDTPRCTDGWSSYDNDGTCLKAFGEDLDGSSYTTWSGARDVCHKHGGDLVIIKDKDKNYFVYNLINGTAKEAWIGIQNLDEDKFDFQFVDGTSVGDFTPWRPGQPNGKDISNQCVMLNQNPKKYPGRWLDWGCTTRRSYVCAKPSVRCTEGWTYYSPEKTCLKAFGKNLDGSSDATWSGAREGCRKHGGDLVIIRDKQKNYFVYNLINGTSRMTWIGIHNLDENKFDFKFVDGSSVGPFAPWRPNEPDGKHINYQCVCMVPRPNRHHGKWVDRMCKNKKPYVCAKPPDQ